MDLSAKTLTFESISGRKSSKHDGMTQVLIVWILLGFAKFNSVWLKPALL